MKVDWHKCWWEKSGNDFYFETIQNDISILGKECDLQIEEYDMLDNNDLSCMLEQVWAISKRFVKP